MMMRISKNSKHTQLFASVFALILILLISGVSASDTCTLNASDTCSNNNLSILNNSVNSVLNNQASNKNITVYFFWGEGCPHCAAIKQTVNTITAQYNVSLKSYEIYHNASNLAILKEFEKRYCIPANESGIPAIFVGNSALIGDKSINKNLRNAIKFAKENNIHAETYKRNCTASFSSSSHQSLTILTVIGAAIVDSINPCAIGVLIIFITFMIHSANFSRRRIAIYGLIYIVLVYLTYFAAGVGLLKFLNFINNLGFIIFVDALVIIVLLIGVLLGFRDTYTSLKKSKKKLFLSIPQSAKGTIERFMKKGTLLSAIILGILVAMVELPCTGQVYLGILTILNTLNFNYGVLLLAIYNLIFVLPLLIILALSLLGKNLSKISETKTKESWLMRYLSGWLMLILAVFLINEVFKFLNFNIALPITFSYAEFFVLAGISIIVLFIIFAILRPIVKKRINIKYCAYCYACALTWIFLAVLYMLGVNVPKILIAVLIGMSLTGIREEFKKFNFKYFGLFTIFLTVFMISITYALLIDYKFVFLLLVLFIFVMDGIIILKNFEIKEGAEKKKKEGKNLQGLLDHCCD